MSISLGKSYLLIYTLILFISTSCLQRKHTYRISGHIEGIDNETVYLSNKGLGFNDADKLIIHDSTISNKGNFVFQKPYKPTDFFSIEIPQKTSGWLPLIIEPLRGSQVKINGHIDSLYLSKVHGSKVHKEFINFKNIVGKEHMDPYMTIIRKQKDIPSYKDSLDVINKKIEKHFIEESKKKPNSYGVLYYTYSYNSMLSKKGIREIYNNLSKRQHNKEFGKMLYNLLNNYSVGDVLKQISLPDTSGKKIKLLPKKQKYVLLDFWASWCTPCIAELPLLKSWYNNSDRSQFEIIGISIDTNADKWKKSILSNNITWKNASDLEGNRGLIFNKLNIRSIPTKVLIEPTGKIVLITYKIDEVEKYLTSKNIIPAKSTNL